MNQIKKYTFQDQLSEQEFIIQDATEYLHQNPDKTVAIITRRHSTLADLASIASEKNTPFEYEKQEDLLKDDFIQELITSLYLVYYLSTNQLSEAEFYFGQVLKSRFWQLDPKLIIRLIILAKENKKSWFELLNEDLADLEDLNKIYNFYLNLSHNKISINLLLDYLVGNLEFNNNNLKFTSPFKTYYFKVEQKINPDLEELIDRLRSFVSQLESRNLENLEEIINYIDLIKANNLNISYQKLKTQLSSKIILLTSHKAKGLEFDRVYIPSLIESEWLKKNRGSKLPLPKNLPFSPDGDTQDDSWRLLFVAFTRAKNELILSAYTTSPSNKNTKLLYFMDGAENKKINHASHSLSSKKNEISLIEFREHLKPTLKDYKLSVTHLQNFLDVTNGGPENFFYTNLLRFPQAKSPEAEYGTAMHKTLAWFFFQKSTPSLENTLDKYKQYLKSSLSNLQLFDQYLKQGQKSLNIYFQEGKEPTAPWKIELDFSQQECRLDTAIMTGRLDRVDKEGGDIIVTDWKTGKMPSDWIGGSSEYDKIKLWKYTLQLDFYKLLIENSRDYHQYKVTSGRLEAIDCAKNKRFIVLQKELFENLDLFKLIEIVYQKIINLDFPEIDEYEQNLKGIKAFCDDLIMGNK